MRRCPKLSCRALAGVIAIGGCVASDTGVVDETEPPPSAGESSGPTSSGDAPSGNDTDDAAFVPDPAWERWSLRFPDYTLPVDDTIYTCAGASFTADGPVHVVAFSPVIDQVSVVHHMVLSSTTQPVEAPERCYPGPEQATMQWGWAPGGGAFVLPEAAGFLVGVEPEPVHYVLQIHYSNPLGRDDIVDASGVDIWITRELRPENVGVLGLGDVAGLVIPAGQSQWPTAHVCSSASTSTLMQRPIHVFGSWLHAHTLATALSTEHSRDGALLGMLGERDPYRFADQQFEPIDAIVALGDELRTRCIYDSTSRTESTFGGASIDDEMCLNFLLYHPWQPFLVYCNDP